MNVYLIFYQILTIHSHDTSSFGAVYPFGSYEWEIHPSRTPVINYQQVRNVIG